jgi:hypothetical protein
MNLKNPVDISKFKKAEFDEWMNSIDVVVSDCDGKMQISKKCIC